MCVIAPHPRPSVLCFYFLIGPGLQFAALWGPLSPQGCNKLLPLTPNTNRHGQPFVQCWDRGRYCTADLLPWDSKGSYRDVRREQLLYNLPVKNKTNSNTLHFLSLSGSQCNHKLILLQFTRTVPIKHCSDLNTTMYGSLCEPHHVHGCTTKPL